MTYQMLCGIRLESKEESDEKKAGIVKELLKMAKEPIDASVDELWQQLWKKDAANHVRAFFEKLLKND